MKKVCLVLGAGAGIGGTVGKKFATEGYHVALCRRSDIAGLGNMCDDIKTNGGSASGHLLNAAEDDTIEELIDEVSSAGQLDTVIFNLGAQIGNVSLEDTSYKAFELGWRMATLGLFRVAKKSFPIFEKAGSGNLIVTSATSSVRGNAGQHSHSAAMAGRRMLCQSLNAEFANKNIHIAHVIVDGAVDAPDTLGKLLGKELFTKMRKPEALRMV